jgi:drug/metabolite transporter (DMT)-like permease
MKSEKLKIWLGFFIISTVWGSTWLAIKIGVTLLPPFFAAGIRFVIASIVLYAIIRIRGLRVVVTPDAKKLYLVMGLLTFFISFGLVYWAEQHIPSGLGSILFASFPFWVALFAHFLLKNEPIDGFKGAGIVMGFLGIVLIFWGDFDIGNPLAGLGMAAMVISTVLQAYVLIVVKRLGHAISPIVMNFCGMATGATGLMLVSALTEGWADIRWNLPAALSILYLALMGSVLTFVTYYWLVKRVQTVYLSLTTFINPIVAVILGAVVLNESVGASLAVGAAMVLAGILVANGKGLLEKIR